MIDEIKTEDEIEIVLLPLPENMPKWNELMDKLLIELYASFKIPEYLLYKKPRQVTTTERLMYERYEQKNK